MKTRDLISASARYGLADMLVVGVSGFLLLPLYTSTLTQAEFGAFVAIKTNIELINYAISLGLLSAVGRLYFDHCGDDGGRSYLASILWLFVAMTLVAATVFALFGDWIWNMMSPAIPWHPNIWFALLIAALTFTGGLGSLWLRMDQRVNAFVGVQLLAATTLSVAAVVALQWLNLGVPGLLGALAIGFIPGTLVLIARNGLRLVPRLRRDELAQSLHYGMPFMLGYLAYFVFNRFSLLTLQRHVGLEDVAIFGLSQQLALAITVTANSFAKTMQPAVFGASSEDAGEILRKSSRLFILLNFAVASGVIIFAREIVQLVAPASYLAGLPTLVIVLLAAYVYSLGLASNTAIEYYRRPHMSAGLAIIGATASVGLGLVLIPTYGMLGGAFAILCASLAATIAGYVIAWRLSGQSFFGEVTMVTLTLVPMAFAAVWDGWSDLGLVVTVIVKGIAVVSIFAALAAFYVPQRFTRAITLARQALGERLRVLRH